MGDVGASLVTSYLTRHTPITGYRLPAQQGIGQPKGYDREEILHALKGCAIENP